MQQEQDGMNIDLIRNKWMPALKTYKQGQAALRSFEWADKNVCPNPENTEDVDARYCCVGVLYEQMEPSPNISGVIPVHDTWWSTNYNFDNVTFSAGMLPDSLWKRVVGSKLSQSLFIYLNDDALFTFDQIYVILDRLTSDESYYNTVIAKQESVFLREYDFNFLIEEDGQDE